MLIVISIFHSEKGRDYTFVHGIFQDAQKADKVAAEVRMNPSYILEEGFEYNDQIDIGISVQIITLPMGVRVNEYVPTEY